MHIAILAFEGFNELDSLIALGVLNRIKKPGWRVTLSCPTPTVTSMNGVTVHAQSTLAEACAADAVIIGSGIQTREIVNNPELMAKLKLDPARQLICAQCSGTLLLAKLGLFGSVPTCTDLTTKPWVQEAGIEVLDRLSTLKVTLQPQVPASHRSILPLGSSRTPRAMRPREMHFTMSRRSARRKRMFPAQ